MEQFADLQVHETKLTYCIFRNKTVQRKTPYVVYIVIVTLHLVICNKDCSEQKIKVNEK